MLGKSFVLLVVGTVMFLLCSVSSADVPHMISYQGKLTTAGGGCLNDTVQITFSIYPDTLGSPANWSETQTEVVVKEGIFNVLLGSVDTIPQAVFDGGIKHLGVQVESDPEMRPLKPMVSVAYAYRAGASGGWVDDGAVVRLADSTDHVGVGTSSPEAKLHVDGDIRTDSVYRIGGVPVLAISDTVNTFVGPFAGENNSGNNCTFVGWMAGSVGNEGDGNTFVGQQAGHFNTLGHGNTFVGRFSGRESTTGSLNTFLGSGAGGESSSGSSNTFVGFAAGSFITTGSYNTFVGRAAGGFNSVGDSNIFVGYNTGYYSEGSGNIFIGNQAGWHETGSDKLYIANGPDTSNVLIYGEFSADRVGINTLTPMEELHVVGDIYCTGKMTSDGGYDPPYVLYDNESREAIVERIAKEVPEEKLDAAVLFWNGDDSRFEVYLPAKGEFRNLLGELLATVDDLKAAR